MLPPQPRARSSCALRYFRGHPRRQTFEAALGARRYQHQIKGEGSASSLPKSDRDLLDSRDVAAK
jgi:hypothetical protein